MNPGKPAPPPCPSAARITLHIDSLHLPGYSARDAGRLAGSLERELGRLLASQQLPAKGYRLDDLALSGFRSVPAERPESTGRRLASLLARGLRR